MDLNWTTVVRESISIASFERMKVDETVAGMASGSWIVECVSEGARSERKDIE